MALVFMMLIAILFTAFGTAIASRAVRFSGLPAGDEFSGDADVFSFGRAVSADQCAASCWRWIATCRSAVVRSGRPAGWRLIGVAHFGATMDLAVLSVVTVVLLFVGGYLFSRIQL